MKIIADQDIYQLEDYFSGLGELVLLPGREISQQDLVDADALLVRTVTKVNRKLIENTSVKFVGSASSGFDHIDKPLLEEKGIHFEHAPGCNANAVVDYFFAVLAWFNLHYQIDWQNKTVGIIGAGNVGSRLATRLQRLGMSFSIYDPFLSSDHELATSFSSLENLLQHDIVTLHTPLTYAGDYPTHHMLNRERLAQIKKDALLINACRGEVIDNQALFEVLQGTHDLKLALDVWESEPDINPSLLDRVQIGTPHIAGYSTNGKLNGTRKIFDDFCQFFSIENNGNHESPSRLLLEGETGKTDLETISLNILNAYPIEKDFIEGGQSPQQLAASFDLLRNTYSFRREFSDYSLAANNIPLAVLDKLKQVGIQRS